jgi:ANTAR domain-containing protein
LSTEGVPSHHYIGGRPFADPGQNLIEVAVPPGTPREAEIAVQRLVELTGILARRCAQLQHALDSRIVIEQAKGVISERFLLDPEDAFDVLRRAARSNRMRIHDLAFRVVGSAETPPELVAQLNGGSRLTPRPQLDHKVAVERIGNPK